MPRLNSSTPSTLISVDRSHVPHAGVLTDEALRTWQQVQGALCASVISNDSEGFYLQWETNEDLAKKGCTNVVANARKAQIQSAVLLVARSGEVVSPFEVRTGTTNLGVLALNELLKEDLLDVRAQVVLEAMIADRHIEKRRDRWSRTPNFTEWKVLVESGNESQAWARLMKGEKMLVTSSIGRDLAKKWAPALSKQHPFQAPQIIKEALQLVFVDQKTPLPKASSPAPLTHEQRGLRALVNTGLSIVAAMEKAQKLAGNPVSTEELLPDALALMRNAFEQKEAQDRQRAMKASEGASLPGASEGSSATASGGSVQTLAGGRYKIHTPWETTVEEGRRSMVEKSIACLDVVSLEWMINQCEDKGQWMALPKEMAKLVVLLAHSVSGLQRSKQEPRFQQQASEAGAQIAEVLIQKGLNLVTGGSVSTLRTDNPFYFLSHLCHNDLLGGAFSHRLISLATRQMREMGLTLQDAEAYLEDTRKRAPGYAARGSSFEQTASIHLERWQLDAEIERAQQERQAVGQSGASSSTEPPASPRRRSARL